MADTMPVFEFYARVLSADGARRKLLARLGPEAGDIIDEFQNYALSAERAGLPGLQAFLETLEAAAPEIKRELDQGRDEVRIMTMHAAKGWKVRLSSSWTPAARCGREAVRPSLSLMIFRGWPAGEGLFVAAEQFLPDGLHGSGNRKA